MANGPIGISFLPSQENQATGLKQGQMEGDLGEAFKILSLRLPRVVGAKAPTPGGNLSGMGASGLSNLPGLSAGADGGGGGFNPNAAMFEALIKALLQNGGGGDGMGPQPKIGFINPGEPNPGDYKPGGTDPITETKGPGAGGATPYQSTGTPGSWRDRWDMPKTNEY